jgi:carboxyl-terminal processing protease
MLNSKSKYAILLLSSVLVAYAIIGGMLGRVSAQNGSYQQLSIFTEVLNRIRNDYVDEPSLKEAVNGAIRGLVESVDPNGGYLSPQDVAFYKSYNPYQAPGIGAVLTKQFGYPMVVATIAGGPAEKAGLSTGDVIESIDGVTTREMNLVQVHGLLANPVGKPADLTVIRRRQATPEMISINRQVTPVPAISSRMLESSIGYIKVPYLAPGKALEAKKHIEDILKGGATSIVLDLRSAAAGEQKEGVELANFFVESGDIAHLNGQKVERQTFAANPQNALTKVPLVVLINQGTSGAAELVAAAITENNRGQLVGMKTFGLAAVQRLLPIEGDWALLMAVAHYQTPSGKEIQGVGITPTVEVPQADEEIVDPTADDQPEIQPTPSPAVEDEDRQLKRAIEMLKDPAQATRRAA